MLSRFISRPLHLRSILTLIASSKTPIFASPLPHHSSSLFPPPNPNLLSLLQSSRSLSADRSGGDDGGTWNLTPEAEDEGSVFGEEEGNLAGIAEGVDDVFGRPETDPASAAAGSNVTGGDLWSESEPKGDIFDEINREVASKKHGQERGGDDDWETAQGYKPWSIGDDEEGRDVFGIGEGEEGIEGIGGDGIEELEDEGAKEKKQLEEQEQQLLAKLKGFAH